MTMTEPTTTTTAPAPTAVEVPIGELHRALGNARLFVGDATRPAINAVRVDITADGDIVLEATDSYALFRETWATGSATAPASFTVAAEHVDSLVKACKVKRSEQWQSVTLTVAGHWLTVRVGTTTIAAPIGDVDSWPPTAKLWPAAPSGQTGGEAVGYGSAMLVRIGKVRAEEGEAAPVRFFVDGPLKPTRLELGKRITMLQMPVRTS